MSLVAVAALAASTAFANPKIGVLMKGRSDFWDAVAKGATAAGARLGADIIIKAPPSETDVGIQIALLRALAGQGIEALVIAPANKDSLAGPVAALAARGVKIVVIDSQLGGHIPSVFVSTDQRAAGAAAGSLLAKLVGDSDEVAFLRHSQAGGATALREEGALEALTAVHPKLAVHGDIYASTEDGVETERSELLLSKYPGAKAIFASGTPGTLAMLKVLTERKAPAKLIGCGFNLNPEVVAGLKSGTLAGWIAQLPEDMGAKAVACALQELSGQSPPPVVRTDFVVVTKDNLGDPSVQALLAL